MILYSCTINYDKLLNRQTTEASESTHRDSALHSKRQEHQKDTMGPWKVVEPPWIKSLQCTGSRKANMVTVKPHWGSHFHDTSYRETERHTLFLNCFAKSQAGYINLNAPQKTGTQLKVLGKLKYYANLYFTNKFNLRWLKVMVLPTQSISQGLKNSLC